MPLSARLVCAGQTVGRGGFGGVRGVLATDVQAPDPRSASRRPYLPLRLFNLLLDYFLVALNDLALELFILLLQPLVPSLKLLMAALRTGQTPVRQPEVCPAFLKRGT